MAVQNLAAALTSSLDVSTNLAYTQWNVSFNASVAYATPFVAEKQLDASFSASVSWFSSYSTAPQASVRAQELLAWSGSMAAAVEANALWVEAITLSDRPRARKYVGGVADPTRTTLAVNVETGAVSRYQNFEFERFVRQNGLVYGVADGLMYLLGGDTDAGAPINASFSLGKTDLKTPLMKGVHNIYLTGRTPGNPMKIRVRSQQGDFTYTADNVETIAQRVRAKLGRGLRSSFFGIEIYNQMGADFELSGVELDATEGQRRV